MSTEKKRKVHDAEEKRKRQREFDEHRREHGISPPNGESLCKLIRALLPEPTLSVVSGREEEWKKFADKLKETLEDAKNEFEEHMEEVLTGDKMVEQWDKELLNLERASFPADETDEERAQQSENWIMTTDDVTPPNDNKPIMEICHLETCVSCTKMGESWYKFGDLAAWRLKGTYMYFCGFCREKHLRGEVIKIQYPHD